MPQPKLKLPKLTPISTPKQVEIKVPIGSIRNGLECLPKKDRKKILLLGDDMRMQSGIATMMREFTVGLCHHFNFVQLGAGINHPDAGKVFDLSQSIVEEMGIPEVDVKVIPHKGYGNQQIVRNLINMERPNAILHFTDPRYWLWLYQMEHEIRQFIPISYYNIWDCIPDPEYNRLFYQSCDLLMAISKQTYGINKRLLPDYEDWQVQYVPHGINPEHFFPVEKDDPKFKEYTKKLFKDSPPKFIVGFNSRNIRRKCVPDIIRAFKLFTETLSTEEKKDVALFLHTARVEQAGTNLVEVIRALKLDVPIYFSEAKISTAELNLFYNLCDVVVNISSNEGFGLSVAESVMAGTPVIVNVTGGLQDQVGFRKGGKYLTAEDYIKIQTLHDKTVWNTDRLEWGPWAEPIWPASINLVGSVPTPYIFYHLPDTVEVGKAISRYYQKTDKQRTEAGKIGREEFIGECMLSAEAMCTTMGKALTDMFKNWKPRERFTMYTVKDK